LMDCAGLPQGALAHAASGMHFLRFDAPSPQQATVYRPLLCLVLQGAKQVSAGAHSLTIAAGQSLIVSHALPVVSRITEAPYVALVFPLDLDLLRGLAANVPTARGMRSHDPFSITLCPTDPAMQDALNRYL
ncbi:AraC family transcriptional regulator N-terminal domain-containing protein, partial [Tropicibacter alexandrii]|uniref:AraC family transcriptional regulator N-terminal domain-containing protein n=1 Tax=Tropicibacter alexandrii TaxID=2267683 RepID=UPI0013E8ACD9